MTTATKIPKFEGRNVAKTSVAVTKAGDGLSAPLTVAPDVIKVGEKRFLLLEVECARVNHQEIKDSSELDRVHTLKTVAGTLVDEDLALPLLNAQAEKIAEARAADPTLFGDEPDDDGDEV